MQSDQQLISHLGSAVEGAKKTLEEAKQRHKARIAALRAEQRQEIDEIQAQVRGYEKSAEGCSGKQRSEGEPGKRETASGLDKESGAWERS